jgi:hypothetical protein
MRALAAMYFFDESTQQQLRANTDKLQQHLVFP